MRTLPSDKAVRRLALRGMLLCLCLVFSYLEARFPLPLPLPGCKPGFANIVVTFCALTLGYPDALALSLLRVLIVSLLFGSASSFWFSLCGALCAFLVLYLLLPRVPGTFSVIGVSAACAAAHNLGQLFAACLLLSSVSVLSYLPVLLLAAILTGTVSGVILHFVLPPLKKAGLSGSEVFLRE